MKLLHKKSISVLLIFCLVATMVFQYDIVARAERISMDAGTVPTPSNADLLRSDDIIWIDSRAELTAAINAVIAQQPQTYQAATADEEILSGDEFIPSEDDLDYEAGTDNEEAATASNAKRSTATASNAAENKTTENIATVSNATDSNAQLRSLRSNSIILSLTETFRNSYSADQAPIEIPGLPSGVTITISGAHAGGPFISDNKVHFKTIGSHQGTYVFETFELWGGAAPLAKKIGGITMTGGTVEVRDVEFRNFNSAAVSGFTALNVKDSVFCDFSQRAITGGTSVVIDNSLFKNVNVLGDHGSAVKIGSSLKVTDSSFINSGGGNGWNGYAAGAIGGQGSGKTLEVSNCYFAENQGNMYGGAISLYQFGGTVKIKDSYFYENGVSHSNTAQLMKADGGAIGVFNNPSLPLTMEIDGCTFLGNTALDDAGALFVESGAANMEVFVTVRNSTFAENEARRADNSGTGGAIQLSLLVNGNFVNNTFTGNICKNPQTGNLGKGAAIGSHFTLTKRPTVTCKNNLFAGNIGSYSSSSKNKVNVGSTMNATDAGGNIGYDYVNAAPAELTLESVYGVSSITTAANGTGREAGCNLTVDGGTYLAEIPTYWIAPAITDDMGAIVNPSIHADSAVGANEYNYDQRGLPRATSGRSDAGAVEITSAKFDANSGIWSSGDTYAYDSPLLYVKQQSSDTVFTYVYSAVDVGTAAVQAPAAPERTDYSFLGWTLTKDGTDFVTAVNMTPERTYYAKWKQNQMLNLTYHLNDGSLATKVDPDGPYLEDSNVTVKSVAQLSWNAPANSYFKAWAGSAAPMVSDPRWQEGDLFEITSTYMNLYAQWQEHYPLSYQPGAGSGVTGMPAQPGGKIDKGSVFNLAADRPERQGWVFEGWISDISGDAALYQPGQPFAMPGQAVTLTARWSRAAAFDLTYHLNDGSGAAAVDPDGTYPDQASVAVKSPSDLGFGIPAHRRFRGWTAGPTPSAGDAVYQKADPFIVTAGHTDLYAQWAMLYTVTFESNGGTAVAPIRDLESGTIIGEPSVSRSGYNFRGWFTDNGTFSNQWDFSSGQVMGDMTLYAKWVMKGGGGGGGGGTTPTNPQPTAPTNPPKETAVPPETSPVQEKPGQHIIVENGVWMVYDPDGVPLGYVLPGDDSGTIYALPKTGDNQRLGVGILFTIMGVSAFGLLGFGLILIRRKKDEE